ncbi:flagellar assembly protein FliW [Hydrogenimonas sp.]
MKYRAVLPILGFDDIDTFLLEPIDDIFYRLKNTEGETPVFTLIQPAVLRNDYTFELPAGVEEKLELEKEEDALVLNVMIVDTPLENSHINFIAPLVFNTKKGLMGQVVLDSVKYPHYGLAESLKKFVVEKEEKK